MVVSGGADAGRRHFSHYINAEIHNNLNRGTHENFENISQANVENRLQPAVAVRPSYSYFDYDISNFLLHIIRAKLYYKYEILNWIFGMICYFLAKILSYQHLYIDLLPGK
jgi:hypothetical protein